MRLRYLVPTAKRFNTQPPEGGWLEGLFSAAFVLMFQHTAARRRLGLFDLSV